MRAGKIKAGVSLTANDYGTNMNKLATKAEQGIPTEQGNNAPLHVAGQPKPTMGKIHIKGGSSYMEGMPADSASGK